MQFQHGAKDIERLADILGTNDKRSQGTGKRHFTIPDNPEQAGGLVDLIAGETPEQRATHIMYETGGHGTVALLGNPIVPNSARYDVRQRFREALPPEEKSTWEAAPNPKELFRNKVVTPTPGAAPKWDEILRERYGNELGTRGNEILAYIGEKPLQYRRPELQEQGENLKKDPGDLHTLTR